MFRRSRTIALLNFSIALAWCGHSISTSPCTAQSPRDILLPTPKNKSIDEETIERITDGYGNQKRQLAELLFQLDRHRIDPIRDSPATGLKKKKAFQASLDQLNRNLMAQMADPSLVCGYIFIKNDVTPRLSGKIVRIGADKDYPDLASAFPNIKKGDSIRFAPGTHKFPELRDVPRGFEAPADLEFFGEDVESTTLEFGRGSSVETPKRWRFSNLKIDCNDSPFIDIHREGTVEIHGCHIFNYNSGAGGSNAIFGINSIVLIENTTMEGDSGRASGRGGGDAFDLRGQNILFARNTHFKDNDEVVRAKFPCVFDQCQFTGQSNSIYGYPGNHIITRGEKLPSHQTNEEQLTHAMNEIAFVEFVSGQRKKLDERSERVASELQLARNPAYWIGLLRHKSPTIRKLAAEKVQQLVGQKVKARDGTNSKELDDRIDLLVQQLGAKSFAERETATQQLEGIGFPAAAKLSEAAEAESSSLEQRGRAKRILESLPDLPELVTDVECGRLLNWYEGVRHQLKWDESQSKYVLPKK